jgi:hypothetical protein
MQKVIIIHLRRPRSKASKPDEKRSDPFWEFGSFGITGCHDTNLMHPRNTDMLNGVRFAFAQGGKHGTRLVHLTPPVKIVAHQDRIEATWSPRKMPFRYLAAPILAKNGAKSDFSWLESVIESVRRPTRESQFSSKFRSCAACVPEELANELINIYDRRRRKAEKGGEGEIARSYADALPWSPPLIDDQRKQTRAEFLKEAQGTKPRRVCVKRDGLRLPQRKAPRNGCKA